MYKTDNNFKIAFTDESSTVVIYNLYQDGVDNRKKPRMVNDIIIQIHSNNTPRTQLFNIAHFVEKCLNEKYFKNIKTID